MKTWRLILSWAWALMGCGLPPTSNLHAVVFKETYSFQGHNGIPTDVQVSHNGKAALSTDQAGHTIYWDLVERKKVAEFFEKGAYFSRLVFSLDDRFAAGAGMHDRLVLFDLQAGKVAGRLQVGSDIDHYSVAISPDGNFLMSGSSDALVRVWDLATQSVLVTLGGHDWPVEDVMFMGEGAEQNRFALTGDPESIRLWDIESGKEVRRLIDTSVGAVGGVTWMKHMNFSADGNFVLAGSAKDVVLFDLVTLAMRQRFIGHKNEVQFVRLDAKGRYAMSGAQDSTVRTWDVETGAEVSQTYVFDIGAPTCVSLLPDGKQFLMGTFKLDIFGGVLNPKVALWAAP